MGIHQLVYVDPDPPNDDVTLDFEIWEGGPPIILHQAAEVFSVAGVDGAGVHLLGQQGHSQQVTLTEYFASKDLAEQFAQEQYYKLPERDNIRVVFTNTDYSKPPYSTHYVIPAVNVLEIRASLRLIGPGFHYPAGASLKLQIDLYPIPIPPP